MCADAQQITLRMYTYVILLLWLLVLMTTLQKLGIDARQADKRRDYTYVPIERF